jgi:hypothetical protein
MYRALLDIRHRAALAATAILILLPGLALAEPQAPSGEEIDDANFGKSFVGKVYDGELEIEDWNDLGGGLVSPPIYIHQYQRDGGTMLVLSSRELSRRTRNSPGTYVVADALIVPKAPKDVEFSMSCVKLPDETLRFLGLAKGKEEKEWWTRVRQAWEIDLETGQIASAKTKGVRCTNIGWGQ